LAANNTGPVQWHVNPNGVIEVTGGSHIVEKRHKAEIHVKLLMAMK
jgi:hypothetical protein